MAKPKDHVRNKRKHSSISRNEDQKAVKNLILGQTKSTPNVESDKDKDRDKQTKPTQSSDPIPAPSITSPSPPSPSIQAPQSSSSSSFIPPTELDNASYNLLPHSILTSSKINKKTTACLTHLSKFSLTTTTTTPATPSEKPPVIMLYANAVAAAKLISIAEIVKRSIREEGGKWFQYNKIEQRRVVVQERGSGAPEGGKGRGKGKDGGDDDDAMDVDGGEDEDEEESTAFETMRTPFERAIQGQEKVRVAPVMVTYLSRVRIEKLRKAYGEQTNAAEITE
ncbi:hypothetical protein F5884DRAFT_766343 [Xylogone sp. PMI_703]|nr:hypothetical protein F5884DRAFT_766343 [Xylogone sp. PMI_703]